MVDESDEILRPKKAAFLAAYAQTSCITESANIAGVARQTHYDWMANDPAYPQLFENARQEANDALQREARRRAIEGWDEPVYQQGVCVGHKRRYSDTCLMALLNANVPEKFRSRVEHTGANGGPMQVASQVAVVGQEDIRRLMMSDPEFVELREQRLLQANGHHKLNGHHNGNGHANGHA
jgi:hypothetical protein